MPETVSATMTTLWKPAIKNDNGIAVFQYPDGSLAEVSCNFVTFAAENSLEIFCEKGAIILNYGDVPSASAVPHPANGLKWIKEGDTDWTYSEIPSPAVQWDRIAWQAEPLADFLNGRHGPVATAAQSRDVLRMVLACYVSSEANSLRVSLNDERINKII